MPAQSTIQDDFGPESIARRFDAACDRFESDWRAVTHGATPPNLEDFLAGMEGKDRIELLGELLRIEEYHRARQEQTSSAPDHPWTTVPNRERAASPVEVAAGATEGSSGYEILGVLGRGGMGIVYRARDRALNRVVALKTVRSGALCGPEVDRFYREARAVARLQHPNIIPIYAIDQFDGSPCYTMPLVTGGNLAQQQQRDHGPVSPREAVVLLEKVARAVQAAHEQGIVHRDLKPANILLDGRGEPLVVDFGLAKLADAGGGPTRTGDVLGTPGYMAPEQVAGRPDLIGPATDVWALGVILYELLTGRRPFQGSALSLGPQIVAADPPSPCSIKNDLPRELDAITLKCLEKEPAQRYESAAALADDLARWLRSEPVSVQPQRWRRARGALRRAWSRLSPMPAALLALALTCGAVASIMPAPVPMNDPRTTPPPAPSMDQALAVIYRQLDSGLSVPLIDNIGRHRWHRWITPGDRPPLRPPEWGFCAFPAVETTLLELCPNPRWDRYLFSVEVQYARYSLVSRAGLYVAGAQSKTALGRLHQFVSFRLTAHSATVGSALLAAERYQQAHPGSAEISNRVNLGARKVSLNSFREWHALSIAVSPAALEARYDGVLVKKVSRKQLDKTLEFQDRELRKLVPNLQPAIFQVRGSLGLYVSDGRAQFRNAILKPLPVPQGKKERKGANGG
jgi:serine/threonine-protein kinase